MEGKGREGRHGDGKERKGEEEGQKSRRVEEHMMGGGGALNIIQNRGELSRGDTAVKKREK